MAPVALLLAGRMSIWDGDTTGIAGPVQVVQQRVQLPHVVAVLMNFRVICVNRLSNL